MVAFLVLNACGRSQKVIERGFYAAVNREGGARVQQGVGVLCRVFIFTELGCFSMKCLGGSTNLAEVFADQC